MWRAFIVRSRMCGGVCFQRTTAPVFFIYRALANLDPRGNVLGTLRLVPCPITVRLARQSLHIARAAGVVTGGFHAFCHNFSSRFGAQFLAAA